MGYLFKNRVLTTMHAPKTDEDLLLLLRENHRKAFEYLYRGHYAMVEYFVKGNSGNEQDAEDIFQETMLVLFDKARYEQFTLSCTVKTFIYSVARNTWLKKLRDNRIKISVKDFERYDDIAVEEDNTENDKQQQVKTAMEQLGEGCRKILVLFYYQKMRMEKIAAELGYTNADNAKNQKYKCLQQLKTKLGNG